jgi:signal peptidase II
MYGLCGIIAIIVFSAEFVIKTYLRTHHPGASIPLIKNILHISVVFNTGAAFGMLQQKTTFLIYIGLVFIFIFLLLAISEKRKSKLFFIACGLIIGGALSNLYDRIFLGFVVDYIDIRIWPVFNIADSCISCGVGLMLWESFRKHRLHRWRNNL